MKDLNERRHIFLLTTFEEKNFLEAVAKITSNQKIKPLHQVSVLQYSLIQLRLVWVKVVVTGIIWT